MGKFNHRECTTEVRIIFGKGAQICYLCSNSLFDDRESPLRWPMRGQVGNEVVSVQRNPVANHFVNAYSGVGACGWLVTTLYFRGGSSISKIHDFSANTREPAQQIFG